MESTSAGSTGKPKIMTGADGKLLHGSQMTDAHVAGVLCKDNTLGAKDKDNNEAPKHQANQHRWMEQWTRGDPPDTASSADLMTCKVSSKPDCEDNTNHLALVDSGANGIVAGEDCQFIGQCSVGRTVNATGTDDHQMTDVRIGTAGALAKSDGGDVIIIMNEAACTGKHTTTLSVLQLEHHGNLVAARATEEKGRQKIITPEGYVFPLSIINGLAHLEMRRHADTEFDSLPHTVLTSDESWNPRQCDETAKANDVDFTPNNPTNYHLLPCDNHDATGECIGQTAEQLQPASDGPSAINQVTSEQECLHDQSTARCIHSAFKATTSDLWACVATGRGARLNPTANDEPTEEAPKAFDTGIRVHEASDTDCKALKPCFACLPIKTTASAFENSTQHGCIFNSEEGNQFKRCKSPQPAVNVHRWDEDILMDEIFASVPAIDGRFKSAMVFFGRRSHIIHVEEMTRSERLLQCMQSLVTKHGAPRRITADHAGHHETFSVLSYLRMLWIRLWFSEACHHHQNLFERKWQTFKRLVNRAMDRTNAPPQLWFLCVTYLCHMLNRTSDSALGGKQPIHVATGSVGDMSPTLAFKWMQPVYFKANDTSFPEDSLEELGHFVGFAETVGHAMTFRVWNKKTNRIVDRSIIRPADDTNVNLGANAKEGDSVRSCQDNKEEPPNVKSKKFPDEEPEHGEPDCIEEAKPHPLWNEMVNKEKGDRGENLIHDPSVRINKDGTIDVMQLDESGNPALDSMGEPTHIPGIKPTEIAGKTFLLEDEDGDKLRFTVVPHDTTEDEERMISNIRTSETEANEKLKIICKNMNGGDCTEEEREELMTHSDACNHVCREQSKLEDGETHWKFRRILAHEGPLTHQDENCKGCSYNLPVEWETGEQTTEPLNVVTADDPVTVALCAKENRMLDTDGWKNLRRTARREKALTRLVNQAKLRSFQVAPKFQCGHQAPRNCREAMALDRQNGNNDWKKAISKELEQLEEHETFIDRGPFSQVGVPKGYQLIGTQWVFAIKHDGRHKARLVAMGNPTAVPLNSVCAGAVSLRGLRIVLFLAERNGLETWATDIGNAHLEARTQEKVCIKAGKAFGALEGHLLVIQAAPCGLRSSGGRFGDLLTDSSRKPGFTQSKAEPQIFMRKSKVGPHCEHLCSCVDNLAFAVDDPAKLLTELTKGPFHYKLKGSGPLKFHLGCGFGRDNDGTLHLNPERCVEKTLETFKVTFGESPRKQKSPLPPNDHPEMDVSELLEDDDVEKCLSLIGQLQWAVSLGRWDIQTAVMTMSSFRVAPRSGHLGKLKHICGHLRQFPHQKIRFRTNPPDMTAFNDSKDHSWAMTACSEGPEDTPSDAPEQSGEELVLTHHFDANLMHDVVTGKTVAGYLHLLNKTPIHSHSKKQGSVETATFGAEFSAARTCMEQVVDLRCTLRCLGVNPGEVSCILQLL